MAAARPTRGVSVARLKQHSEGGGGGIPCDAEALAEKSHIQHVKKEGATIFVLFPMQYDIVRGGKPGEGGVRVTGGEQGQGGKNSPKPRRSRRSRAADLAALVGVRDLPFNTLDIEHCHTHTCTYMYENRAGAGP